MSYRNHHSDRWDHTAYKQGYEDGYNGRYSNPYTSSIGALLGGGGFDPHRAAIYDEGHEDGKTDRWRR